MTDETKFPSSIELFKFIRKVANRDFSDDALSDAALGRIVGLEGARTSRWKHGKIAVDDAPRLITLCQNFSVDIALLAHLAAGYISAQEAWKIYSSPNAFLRFIGDHAQLPANDHAITITDSEGSEARIVRKTATHYSRKHRQSGSIKPLSKHETERIVVLADDDASTIEVFRNMTAQRVGVSGITTTSLTDALMIAGQLNPDMVIVDLFLNDADGFSTLRSLARDRERFYGRIIATSNVISSDITRKAKGCGAEQILERPLSARPMGKLLRSLTTG